MIPAHLVEKLPLIADGAPGDLLRARHPKVAGPVEAFNLRRPEWVRAAHGAYFQAGARVLRTNSAHANEVALGIHGLEERCEAINNSATALLRAAVGQQALVMGAIAEIRSAALPVRERAYGQQIVYLADTGVDFIVLEDCSSAAEASLVRRLAREAGDAPLLALLTVDASGRTADGMTLREGVQSLADSGVDAAGAVFPPQAELPPLVALAVEVGLPTAVFLGGNPTDPMPPETFAAKLGPLAEMGVVVLGGGAGVGPGHVEALVQWIRAGNSGK